MEPVFSSLNLIYNKTLTLFGLEIIFQHEKVAYFIHNYYFKFGNAYYFLCQPALENIFKQNSVLIF